MAVISLGPPIITGKKCGVIGVSSIGQFLGIGKPVPIRIRVGRIGPMGIYFGSIIQSILIGIR